MAIQVRRGNEVDFDPSKMLPGEWAVSLDTKYVRMCFSPGVCLRMATYEGFEADMAQIQQILSEVRTAEAAIKKIQSEVDAQAEIVDENTDLCEEYARRAENAADRAEAVTDIHYATKDRAGIVAPQDIHVDEQGNMVMIAETTDSTLRNSYAGGISILGIHGKCEQDGEPTPDYPQEIKKSVVSEVLTHRKNLLKISRNEKLFMLPAGTVSEVDNYCSAIVDVRNFNTVSMSGDFSLLESNAIRVGLCMEYPVVGVAGTRENWTTNWTKDVSDYNYLLFSFGEIKTDAEYEAVVNSFMLTEGSIDTTYEPYSESVATLSNPIELGGIGDVADVLDAKEIKRRFATVVFDGSDDEGWGTMNTNDNATKRVTTRSLFAMPSVSNNSIPNILCTHYKAVTPANTHSRVRGITVSGKPSDGGNTYLYVYDENFNTSDISLWKAHLAANPMTVVYELADHTTEELPTADQIALNSLKSFDGVTYVETDSEVKPTIHSRYGTSEVGAMALELQNENANLKLQMNNAKSTEITETEVRFSAKMSTDTTLGVWNVELQRPTDADYTLLGWTIINPKANVANVYVTTVDGYALSGDVVESGAHAAFSVTIRAMWSKS